MTHRRRVVRPVRVAGGGVRGARVMGYGAMVRILVPHRGMGPGTLLTGPNTGIWEN